MKTITFLFALLLTAPLAAEFYGGVGLGWSMVDESFDSDLSINENTSGRDQYETTMNRLAPVVQIGCQTPSCDGWTLGLLAQWKYLNYQTPNVDSSLGQILPNASFSSINIFGPGIERDFSSKTHIHNEVMLLGYLGMQICNGHAYLGLGPVGFDASNSIYVFSVHTPNGVGDHLIATSVINRKMVWGGALQAGYQYNLHPNFFINVSYTYLQSRRCNFNNSANTAILNGGSIPGPTILSLRRSIRFTAQEFMISMNLAF